MQKKLVVFDLDGTLNQTDLFSVPAHKKALADIGVFDKSDEFIVSLFGERSEDCVHLLVNSKDPEVGKAYLKRVAQYETEYITQYGGCFDGVKEMLALLKNAGYFTAVCSNASERYIRLVLNSLSIIDKIDYIQPLVPNMIKDDTLRLLIDREKPDCAVMVGDRIFDKAAAVSNSLPFIGCLYGYKREEVEDADIAVSSPIEIFSAVQALIG